MTTADPVNSLYFPVPISGDILIKALQAVTLTQIDCQFTQEKRGDGYLVGQNSYHLMNHLVLRIAPGESGLVINPDKTYSYLTVEHHIWPGLRVYKEADATEEASKKYLDVFQLCIMKEITALIHQPHQ